MAKSGIIILLLISSLMLIADARFLSTKTEKIVEFRVYFHDVFGGPNATVVEVARANTTSNSLLPFGQVIVIDDIMTAGPDANSQKLGRSQGLIANTGREELSLTYYVVFLFTAGEYKGSSLSVMGWRLVAESNEGQEMPIVGGTGVFRSARGYTVSSVYSQDPATNYLVLSYLLHIVYLD